MILTPLQKLTKYGEDQGKLIVTKGFTKLPKVQNIAQSGHTEASAHTGPFGFTQFASLFHQILSIFACLERDSLLSKTHQCECCLKNIGFQFDSEYLPRNVGVNQKKLGCFTYRFILVTLNRDSLAFQRLLDFSQSFFHQNDFLNFRELFQLPKKTPKQFPA